MNILLSIDVGIKNLAFCLFTYEKDNILNSNSNSKYKIIKWDIINLCHEQNESKCDELEKLKKCNKPAKFSKNGKCYCQKHCKKQPFKILTPDLKPSFVNKQKIKVLHELIEKYKINHENENHENDIKNIKKDNLISLINKYVIESCFDPIISINASKIDLITIGRNIKLKLNDILNDYMDIITHVIIENQISPIANRMKTIQGMIAQYFIMNNDNIIIEFISASNKLKDCDIFNNSVTKPTYNERKKIGIQYCSELITNNFDINNNLWESFFKNHKKKDDLADSFLQGVWYINK